MNKRTTDALAPAVVAAMGADYRAGILSLREIGYRHKVSHQTVKKYADKEGWTRDLSARIQSKAQAIVDKASVDKASDTRQPSEREVVDGNAMLVADIKLRHRADIRAARDEVMALLDELRRQRVEIPGIESIAARLASEDKMPEGLLQLRAALERGSGLDKRISMARALVEAIAKLVAIERVAYGIKASEEGGGGDGSYEELLQSTLDEHA